jgi:hypothetical protein
MKKRRQGKKVESFSFHPVHLVNPVYFFLSSHNKEREGIECDAFP